MEADLSLAVVAGHVLVEPVDEPDEHAAVEGMNAEEDVVRRVPVLNHGVQLLVDRVAEEQILGLVVQIEVEQEVEVVELALLAARRLAGGAVGTRRVVATVVIFVAAEVVCRRILGFLLKNFLAMKAVQLSVDLFREALGQIGEVEVLVVAPVHHKVGVFGVFNAGQVKWNSLRMYK